MIYGYADANAPGLHPIELSVVWILVGIGAFLLWARGKGEWPFGPKHVHEAYLHADPRTLDVDEEELAAAPPRSGGGPRRS